MSRLSSTTVPSSRPPRIEAFGSTYEDSILVTWHGAPDYPATVEFASNRPEAERELTTVRAAMDALCLEAGNWPQKPRRKREAALRAFDGAARKLSNALTNVSPADFDKKKQKSPDIRPASEFIPFIVAAAENSAATEPAAAKAPATPSDAANDDIRLMEVYTPPKGLALPWELLKADGAPGEFLGDRMVFYRRPDPLQSTERRKRERRQRPGLPNQFRPDFEINAEGFDFDEHFEDDRFAEVLDSAEGRGAKYAEDKRLKSRVGAPHGREELATMSPICDRQDIEILGPLSDMDFSGNAAVFQKWSSEPGGVWHFNGHGALGGTAVTVSNKFPFTGIHFQVCGEYLTGGLVFLNSCYSNVPILTADVTLAGMVACDAACVCGTNGPVDDFYATVFSRHVYEALGQSATVAEAVGRAKAAMKADKQPPIYLFYSIAGRPHHRVR